MKFLSTAAFIGVLTLALPAMAQSAVPFETPGHAADRLAARQLLAKPGHDAGSDPAGHVIRTQPGSGDSRADFRPCLFFQIDTTGNQWYAISLTAGVGAILASGQVIRAAENTHNPVQAGDPIISFTQFGTASECGGFPIADSIALTP